MPTRAKRRWCIDRSIRCFLAQSYERSVLMVVDDPDEGVRDLVTPWFHTGRIHYSTSDAKTLGEKYNDGCRSCPRGVLIALWGDDDWHHPDRLKITVDALVESGADVAGSVSMLVYRVKDRAVFLYSHPFAGIMFEIEPGKHAAAYPNMIGGTMLFKREVWLRYPFPPLATGSDSVFALNLLAAGGYANPGQPFSLTLEAGDNSRALVITNGVDPDVKAIQINDPRLYVAMVHGDNTGNPLVGSGTAHEHVVPDDNRERITSWERLDSGEDASTVHNTLRLLMGAAAPLFLDQP